LRLAGPAGPGIAFTLLEASPHLGRAVGWLPAGGIPGLAGADRGDAFHQRKSPHCTAGHIRRDAARVAGDHRAADRRYGGDELIVGGAWLQGRDDADPFRGRRCGSLGQ